MVKRGVSIGFLGRFGRSQDLRYLDSALQNAHLYPGIIPEGAKMAAVTLMSEYQAEPPAAAYPPVGALMALCAFGRKEFTQHNGVSQSAATVQRFENALERGEGLDASIILLMFHAKLLHQTLKDEYDIEATEAG